MLVAPTVVKKEVNQDKLHWTVKHTTSFKYEDDFLETILIDCGVKKEDIPKFLHPTKDMRLDPFTLRNMKEAVELIHKHVTKGNKIAILPDNDNDGLCSAAILGQFLSKDLEQEIPEIIYVFSEGKSHGLTYDLIKNFKQGDIDLFIIPDASLTCEEAQLIKKNFPKMDLLVIDHHLVSVEYFDEETNCWILEKEAKEIQQKDPDRIKMGVYTNGVLSVNCTDGQYKNPHLSGGGVVQKVIEAYEQTYPQECSDDCTYKYLDLVALAICGDGMDLRPLESRYYVVEGMRKAYARNPFFNELQDRLSDEMKFGRYITSAEWVLIPKVNGVVRFGKVGKKKELGEKEQLFYAMLGKEGTVEYKPRRKSKNDPEPEIEEHTLAWDAARMAVNVKSRQDTEVRKYFKILQERIEEQHLDENSVIFVDGSEIVEKSETTGLIANKLASTYHRPIVLMKEFDSETFGGSGRGYAKSNIKDLNSFLSNVGITCMGHDNAFGVRFNKTDLDSIIQKCNELQPLDSLQIIHEVDWEIPAKNLKRDYVSEVANQYEIWGNTIPEPVFVITNLVINASDINAYGEHNGFIRFNYNNVVFTKKYCPATDYDRMICKSRTGFGKPKYKVKLNLICQFVLNVWEEKVNPEVKILYFDSIKYDESSELNDWLDNNVDRNNMANISADMSTRTDSRSVVANKNISRTSTSKLKVGQQIVKMSKVEDEEDSQNDENNKVEVKSEVKTKSIKSKLKKATDDDWDDFDDWDDTPKKVVKKAEKKSDEKVDSPKKKVYTIDDELDFDW